jgi:hypothetical protein
MFQIDENFLISLGLGAMSPEDKESFISYLSEELELRVGTELSKNLSDEQLEQFEKVAESDGQGATASWLEQQCPDYKDVVKREFEKLKQEIQASRDRLLSVE